LKEKRTRWYVAEMILCVEEAHRLRWIHRDVKPDNFLITASGHLKISDFGLAFDGHWAHDQSYFNNHRYSLLEKLGIKVEGDLTDRADLMKVDAGKKLANILMRGREIRGANNLHEVPSNEERGDNDGLLQWRNKYGKRKFARSVVGTSQYMAPEVIRGELYDGRCDWWSIGIIMFECLYGWTPFVGEDRPDTKARILNHQKEFRFPPTAFTEKKYKVSHEAKDLVNRLLQEKEHRLCSKKYLVNDYDDGRAPLRPAAWGNQLQLPQDPQGYFVFPDDATDIKSHPFFQGIPWERLHLTKPPEVPDVKSRYDTKYFDEDEPISDVDDASSTLSLQEQVLKAQEEYEEEIVKAYEAAIANDSLQDKEAGPQVINATAGSGVHAKTDVAATGIGDIIKTNQNKMAKVKEKKRPRDRILRDTKIAKQVLEIRKRGAFIGYTYRRPRPVLTSIENRRLMGEPLSRRTRLSNIL
jgi:protein-serine/threonine kinase